MDRYKVDIMFVVEDPERLASSLVGLDIVLTGLRIVVEGFLIYGNRYVVLQLSIFSCGTNYFGVQLDDAVRRFLIVEVSMRCGYMNAPLAYRRIKII